MKKINIKPANEIKFVRQIKVSIKCNNLVLNRPILCVTYFVTSIVNWLTRKIEICVIYSKWCQCSLWHQAQLTFAIGDFHA